MLVLSRKFGEKIVIGDGITVSVVQIRGDKVRLGIEAPPDVPVHRLEVWESIHGVKDGVAGTEAHSLESGASPDAAEPAARATG